MPVEVIWDDEQKTVIRQIYRGIIVLADYYTAIDQFCELAESVDYTVHSIMDRTAMMVSHGSYMEALRYGNSKMPDNVGLRVVIKGSGMTKMMITIGARIAPKLINNVHLVDTLEEARAVIAKYISTTSGHAP